MKKHLSYILFASLSVSSAAIASQMRSPEGSLLGLETDAYYTVGVKALNLASGYVTYTNPRSPSGHYTQLATKKLDKYGVGREWRENALWRFYATEVPNYYSIGLYKIGNGGRDPNVYLTYSDQETKGGNGSYVQIADKNTEHFAPNGQWRDSALWAIHSSENSGFYTLTPKSLPQGFMSTTAEDSPGGVYLQILHKQNTDKCQAGGEWRDHALWGFWKVPLDQVETHTQILTPQPTRQSPIIICPFPPSPTFGGQADFDFRWRNGGGHVGIGCNPGMPPNINVSVNHQWQF